jgi:hypothetical protein
LFVASFQSAPYIECEQKKLVITNGY